ncbi:MAG: universal stress protein [Bryobacteraceae bacterium]|nr:universal stress protein [Bryobacteraceae bacterium]
MKVLIATDGSPNATQALQMPARLLRPENLELNLVCVAPTFPTEIELLAERYRRRMSFEKRRILENARALLPPLEGVRVSTHTEFGSAAEVIVRLSAQHDLTVIGARGRNTAPHVGLGPTASRIAQAAASPLWIARASRNPEGCRVLMAVDGSANSVYAIEKAVELFDLSGAEITLLHVTETPWLNFGLDKEWLEEMDDEQARIDENVLIGRSLQAQSSRLLLAAADRLRDSHPGLTMGTEEGLPANEILSAADRGDFDLIVMGATGFTDMKQALLGSVSMRVAWDAPCSVLLVPR